MTRASVRGVIVDPENRVLLIKWTHPKAPISYWLTPGGGVEEGEDDATALARELAEETSLTAYEPGPHVATCHWSDGDEHRFYLVRCPHFEPATGEGHPDYEVFDEYRWWSADELDNCPALAPEPDVANLLKAILGGDVPDAPLEWFPA